MEQKKLLWIISGVGLFLLVIFLTAMIIYKPTSTIATPIPVETISPSTTEPESGWKPVEDPKNDISTTPVEIPENETTESDIPVSSDTKPEESVNVSDLFQDTENQNSQTVTTIDLNELKNQLNKDSAPQNINITVNIPDAEVTTTTSKPANVTTTVKEPISTPAKTESTIKDAAAAEKAEKEASVSKNVSTTSSKVETTTSTASTTVTSKPAATTTSTTKPTSTSTSSTKPVVNTTKTESAATTSTIRYWVQVASYSTKKAAENARDVLAQNKIESDIFTYTDSKNEVHFRVRIGPYTSKNEAEYWMKNVKTIKFFENSGAYVTQTSN